MASQTLMLPMAPVMQQALLHGQLAGNHYSLLQRVHPRYPYFPVSTASSLKGIQCMTRRDYDEASKFGKDFNPSEIEGTYDADEHKHANTLENIDDCGQEEQDALLQLLPFIGTSKIRTALLLGVTGALAPYLEETLFRGFLMASLSKWIPMPLAVIFSSVAFALAHFTPAEIPQLFALGLVLGFTYAKSRNLLTPIMIHAMWNSGVVLLLTFLRMQGYDIQEII